MQEIGIWIVAWFVLNIICGLMISRPSPDHGDAAMAGFLAALFVFAVIGRIIWLLISAWF